MCCPLLPHFDGLAARAWSSPFANTLRKEHCALATTVAPAAVAAAAATSAAAAPGGATAVAAHAQATKHPLLSRRRHGLRRCGLPGDGESFRQAPHAAHGRADGGGYVLYRRVRRRSHLLALSLLANDRSSLGPLLLDAEYSRPRRRTLRCALDLDPRSSAHERKATRQPHFGLTAGHCSVRDNGQEPLARGEIGFPTLLRARGYHTRHIGKWGLGGWGSGGSPLDKGFESYYGQARHPRHPSASPLAQAHAHAHAHVYVTVTCPRSSTITSATTTTRAIWTSASCGLVTGRWCADCPSRPTRALARRSVASTGLSARGPATSGLLR